MQGLCLSLLAHQAGQYFIISPVSAVYITRSISTTPERDTTPLKGYPQHYICWYPFYAPGWKWRCESSVSAKSTAECSQSALDPRSLDLESSTVTLSVMSTLSGNVILLLLDYSKDCRVPSIIFSAF